MNQPRHRRTLSGVAPNAQAICRLVQLLADSTISHTRWGFVRTL